MNNLRQDRVTDVLHECGNYTIVPGGNERDGMAVPRAWSHAIKTTATFRMTYNYFIFCPSLFQSEATERKHDYFYTTKPKMDDKRARHVNPMYYGSQYIK